MKLLPIIITTLMLLLLISCEQNKKENIFVDFKNSLGNMVSTVPEMPLTKKFSHSINIEKKLLCQYKIVPKKVVNLFPNNKVLIGKIGRIKLHGNRIYLHDTQTHALHISTKEGKWINTIRRVGKGEGEYFGITDFTIDKKNNILIIADVKLKKLIYFEMDGKYIKEIHFPFWFREFSSLPSGDLCFLTLGKNYTGYKILICDKNGKIKRKAIPIPIDEVYRLNMYSRIGSYVKQNKNNLSITTPFTDDIYTITNDTISQIFKLNLGKNKLPFYNTKHLNIGSFNKLINESEQEALFYLGGFLETKKNVLLGLFKSRSAYNIIYRKSQMDLAQLNMNLYGKAQLSFPVFVENENFISIADACWISDHKKELKNIPEFEKVLDQLTPASNPVLVTFNISESHDKK